MGLLSGKVALVTGAGRAKGIGYAACRRLAQAGAQIVLTDLVGNTDERVRIESRVSELRNAGAEALGLPLDVRDLKQAHAVTAQVIETFGHLDIVFNNAGYPGGVGPFLELGDDHFNTGWQVNLMGCVNLSRAAIPLMQERGGGSIINNASLAGLGVTPEMSGYSASKFAVVGLTKALAAEFGADNIRVNAVCPGLVWTDMGALEVEFLREEGQGFDEARVAAVSDVPLQQRWADPEEVGDAVVYLASSMSSYVTGVALPVAGGLGPGL